MMNWRRSEWISMSTLIIVAGWIWWASAKAAAWDLTAQQVGLLAPIVSEHDKKIAVLIETIDDIKEDTRYIRRHTHG